MIVVADSGSTKTDWLAAESAEQEPLSFQSPGINPLLQTALEIEESIKTNKVLLKFAPKVKAVYFYGASCSSPERVERVKGVLQKIFPQASIMVSHDMMGAVVATTPHKPGIVCILGTGSNACYFDGTHIHDDIPSLGFILGDEGSGAWFGKRLARDFLYGRCPGPIASKLRHEYGLEKEGVLERVYNMPKANTFLASLAKVLGNYPNEAYVQSLLQEGFRHFIECMVKPYWDQQQTPVHFVGSLAQFYETALVEALESYGMQAGIIVHQPASRLLQHHLAYS